MTIYNISIITSTGFPYYHKDIKKLPDGIKLYQRFFDFTEIRDKPINPHDTSFELNAGLVSALFGFAKNLDKEIRTLEFKSLTREIGEKTLEEKKGYKGDALITAQTETYLLHKSVKEKVNTIYNSIISHKIPLEDSETINEDEEKKIIDILTDTDARNRVYDNQIEIQLLATKFLEEMERYGLFNIIITSFDLSPIAIFGDKYTFQDIEIILRNLGDIPEIDAFEWKHRQGFYEGTQVWVYLINSGIGVTVEKLFEPYFYLLITGPESYLAEFPAKLTREFNQILD
ncbi:MAG: hypothetical protein ACFE8A_11955 [Candidatus Hodarchaeota archaeon]